MIDIKHEAINLQETLAGLRQKIHAHPEYGFCEHNTTDLIAETLENLCADVNTGIAKTGVVAEIGEGLPVVAIRADMDALPIQEKTGLPFASKVPDMMHACGHDAHVACALGAAMLLAKRDLKGRIRFLFQPSEEQKDADGKSGAMRLLEEDAFEDVSAVIALHTRGLPVGSIGITKGAALAANDTFKIVIRGRAAHGAHPEDGIDAIAIAAQIYNALQQIVSRRLPAAQPVVISVTTINGGIKENVIAEQVELGGTIRSTGGKAREKLLEEMEKALDVGRTLGAGCELEILEGYPVTVNDSFITEAIRKTATELLGKKNVIEMPFDTWAEDFGYLTECVPGAMFWLGVTSERVPNPVWHSAEFDLDEDALPVGAMILAATAQHLLEEI